MPKPVFWNRAANQRELMRDSESLSGQPLLYDTLDLSTDITSSLRGLKLVQRDAGDSKPTRRVPPTIVGQITH
jgi:hypothetical protein